MISPFVELTDVIQAINTRDEEYLMLINNSWTHRSVFYEGIHLSNDVCGKVLAVYIFNLEGFDFERKVLERVRLYPIKYHEEIKKIDYLIVDIWNIVEQYGREDLVSSIITNININSCCDKLHPFVVSYE